MLYVFLKPKINNYMDEVNEETRICIEKDISMDLEDRPPEVPKSPIFGVSNDETQAAGTHSDGEQNQISTNILAQSDLNYIIDTVGEISNDGIENYCLSTSIFCENETPQPVAVNDIIEEPLTPTKSMPELWGVCS